MISWIVTRLLFFKTLFRWEIYIRNSSNIYQLNSALKVIQFACSIVHLSFALRSIAIHQFTYIQTKICHVYVYVYVRGRDGLSVTARWLAACTTRPHEGNGCRWISVYTRPIMQVSDMQERKVTSEILELLEVISVEESDRNTFNEMSHSGYILSSSPPQVISLAYLKHCQYSTFVTVSSSIEVT